MNPERKISVVIPNYNNASTIEKCLEAVFSSEYKNFEVIVVDDCSEDNSLEIIRKFPCKLIILEKHSGTSKARNTGAQNSSGDAIFFTDADCLLNEDTLSIANKILSASSPDTIIGGTYTRIPHDKGFFNLFQSVFINHSETRKPENPDYIAAHAMVINTKTFRRNNGFPEKFMPIIEDVEFSHRLRKNGCQFIMNPKIEVRHIFNFTLFRSLKNAFRKSKYWTMYSLKNKGSFADSGTASVELKINVASFFLGTLVLITAVFLQEFSFFFILPLIFAFNCLTSRGLLKAFYESGRVVFAFLATLYYTLLYPVPVGTGAITGMLNFLLNKGELK